MSMEDTKKPASYLRMLRTARGLTLDDVAANLGLSNKNIVSRHEKFDRGISNDDLMKYADSTASPQTILLRT